MKGPLINPWDALDAVLAEICPPQPDEDDFDQADGCLACGEPVCDCDRRYDETREAEDGR